MSEVGRVMIHHVIMDQFNTLLRPFEDTLITLNMFSVYGLWSLSRLADICLLSI